MNLIETMKAMLNEARILGHAEAKTKMQKEAAARLVDERKFTKAGHLSDKKRTPCFKLSELHAANARAAGIAVTDGPRVRFTINTLGASESGNLTRMAADVDTYNVGDEGVVAFEHPNAKISMSGWVYVEVDSKSEPKRKLYVAVGASMYEVIR